ncbi:MAG: hypothetical protein FWD84_05820 [Oscillospiraceae bacterium]|nr:hypothetical protein [Oscillospiraceae bacterium]
MKSMKLIISLAAAIVVVSAAIAAVVIFQEELTKLFRDCCDYCKGLMNGNCDEADDFVDM